MGDGGQDTTGPWFCGPPEHRRAYRIEALDELPGGQGTVLRAERSTFPNDPVAYEGPAAVKLHRAMSAEQIAKLIERSRRLASLRHPNLGATLEAFVGPGLFREATPPDADDNSAFYSSTVWVDGMPLRQHVPMEPAAAFRLCSDLAAGLTVMHRNGFVHRDVHPGNVVVRPDGTAVLIDFSSAGSDDGESTVTVTGAHGFIPPEALHGPVDRRADGWQLAMCTAFALVGHARGTTHPEVFERELRAAVSGIAAERAALATMRAMLHDDPAERPDDLVAWAASLERCLTKKASVHRRIAVAVVGLACFAGAGAAAFTLIDRGDDGDASISSEASTLIDHESHDAAVDLARTATSQPSLDGCPTGGPFAEGLDTRIIGVIDQLPSGTCIADIERFADATVVRLDRERTWAGVVVATETTDPVWMPNTVWSSYKEIAGRTTPENAATAGGYPISFEYLEDSDGVLLRLAGGGIVLGPRDDTQVFWIPPQALALWEQHGGREGTLGFPTSNPYIGADGLRQDYAFGFMRTALEDIEAAADNPELIEVVLPEHPGEALLELGHLEGRIVGQPTVTSWFIDEHGVRHWIPDGGTWVCLGGQANVASDSIPGYAMWTLPLGPPAKCP